MRGAGFRERVGIFVNSLGTVLFRLLFVRFLPCFFFFSFFSPSLGWLAALRVSNLPCPKREDGLRQGTGTSTLTVVD